MTATTFNSFAAVAIRAKGMRTQMKVGAPMVVDDYATRENAAIQNTNI